MKTSEGKKITIELNEFQIEVLLKALGTYQNSNWNSYTRRDIEKIVNKVYRAMGVRL